MPHVRGLPPAVLIFLCLIAPFAWGKEVFHAPTPEELAMTGYPAAPGAHAVILEWDHRQDDTDAWESEYFRIKIFDRDAAKYADIELPYLGGGSSWIRRLEARTIHPDGKIIPFDGKTYDKVIVKSSRLAFMARTFTLPDVQPGSILEYFYVRASSGRNSFPTHWVLQRELPVLKETVWFSPLKSIPSYYTHAGLPPGTALKQEVAYYELTLENMPAAEAEPFSPPEGNTNARIDFYYKHRDIDYAHYWEQVSARHAAMIAVELSDSRLIRKTAVELTAGASTPDEKLRRIYARVQQIRNVTYEPSRTDREQDCESDNVDSALKNGCGRRVQLNRLFVSLARAAGLDAYVVEASTRDDRFFAKQVPDYSQLDREIALVVIDGREHFYDPATPMTPFGILPWEVTGVPGMKLVKGAGVFVGLPHLVPTDAIVRRKADLRIDGDVVKGSVTIAFIGEEALQQRLARRNDDEATVRKAIEELVKTWLPEGSSVKLTSLGSMRSGEEPLTAGLDVELGNAGSTAGSRMLLPLSIFTAASRNPFAVSERRHDIYFRYERQAEDEVVLAMPDGYTVESLPPVRELNLGGLAFRNSWSREGNAVTFKRTFTVNTLLIDKANHERVRQFYDTSLAADQESIILKH